MDDHNAGPKPDPSELKCRPPVETDLASLGRELNQRGVRYVVVGGFFLRYWFSERGEQPPGN